MSSTELNKKQLKFLKTLTHGLDPIVRVGQHGLTEGVLKELEIALDHHELVKIKVAADDREARDKMLQKMCKKTGAQTVQQIGGVAVLYRQNAKKPVIDLKQAQS